MIKYASGAAELDRMAVVRVRFLVALVVMFGVLASVLGAVAAQASRQADEWRDLHRAQDTLQQSAWPETFRLALSELDGCRPSATTVCLVSTESPPDAARAVASVLPVTPTESSPPLDGVRQHRLTGLVGEHTVSVDVRDPAPGDDVPEGGSRVAVVLDPVA